MSRPFREKNKDLVNLVAVPASVVWTKNKSGKAVYEIQIANCNRLRDKLSLRIGKLSQFVQSNGKKALRGKIAIPKAACGERGRQAVLGGAVRGNA